MKLKGIIHNVENRIRNGFKAVANSGYRDGPAGYKKRVWQGFDFHSATPRADADDCIEKLRDRCRSVWYNSGLARNIVSIYGDWTLGNGLELKSESKTYRNEIEKAFNDWAISKRCDSRNDCDFFTLQRQIFDSLMINGEVFVIIHRFADDKGNVSVNLEAVEGDAVRQPPVDVAKDRRIVSGIELNRYSEAVAYWFYNSESNKWSRIRRYDENGTKVIHLRRRERLGSVRGVPLIAPAIESIVQIERYSASELQTALLESCFSVVVKTDERIPESTLEQPIQPSPYSFDLGSGNINFIPTDSEIATIDGKRNQNATSLSQYVECITKTNVCSAVQIPFEILMSEFNSSYSASRASCLLFDRKATQVRDAFVLDFMNEVFVAFTDCFILNNRLALDEDATSDIRKATWIGPTPPSLDPNKQIEYIIKCIDNGLMTRKDASMEISRTDYESNIRQLKEENRLLSEVNGTATEVENG